MTTDLSWDRIDPWKAPPSTAWEALRPKHHRETLGTEFIRDGEVLRAHGGGDGIDAALLRAHYHAEAMGKFS